MHFPGLYLSKFGRTSTRKKHVLPAGRKPAVEHLEDRNLLSAAMANTAMPGVVEGPLTNPANGHQYYIVAAGSWTTAESEAQSIGGNLVTIRNAAENAWIADNLIVNFPGDSAPQLQNSPVWIGFYDPTQDANGNPHASNFVWADGEPVTYTDWYDVPGDMEPNNLGGDEYYGTMNWQFPYGVTTDHSVWNDAPLNGTVDLGGNTNGPYYGIAEVIPSTTTPTVTTVSPSSPTALSGSPVTLTATVSPASGSGTTPTGTVTFYSNGSDIGAINLDGNGQAALTLSSLPTGTDSITASYSGDGNYSASSASPTSEMILARSPVVPSISGAIFPPVIVAGQKFVGKIPLVLVNGGANLKGTFIANLYVSNSPSLDGSQVSVATISENLSLKANRSARIAFALKSLPSSLPAGTYYFIAEITDPNGASNIGEASRSVQVAAPFVQPVASVGAVTPALVGLDKTATVLVEVTNAGNIAGNDLAVTLGVSTDQSTQVPGITLAAVSTSMKLAPGKSAKLKIRFKLTPELQATLGNGSYFPFVSVSLDGVSASMIGSTTFAVAFNGIGGN